MIRYNTLNIRMSNSQLNKLKSGIENFTDVTVSLLSNVTGDSKCLFGAIKLTKNASKDKYG